MSENVQSSLNNAMNDFSSSQAVNSTNSSFLNSNSIIAKIVFLIMVAIAFIVLFYGFSQLIGYFFGSPKNPLFINGQINANVQKVIPQNPANSKTQMINRSNNETTGIEFTWCVWLNYISSNKQDKLSPIFIKGDCNAPSESIACSINNGPGVYFLPSTNSQSNSIVILMDTINKSAAEALPSIDKLRSADYESSDPSIIVVKNLPVSNYFHLAIRCRNSYIDVYINGTVVKTQNLMNVPKQNYYDLNICPCGGFNGYLSNLQYFIRSLTVVEINTIVQNGPNTNDLSRAIFTGTSSIGISTSWFNSFLK